jgi:hypothetical protein
MDHFNNNCFITKSVGEYDESVVNRLETHLSDMLLPSEWTGFKTEYFYLRILDLIAITVQGKTLFEMIKVRKIN